MKFFNFSIFKKKIDDEPQKVPVRERSSLKDCGSGMPYINSTIFERGLNGYLNYRLYNVTGLNSENKVVTIKINSINDVSAKEQAASNGLAEPITITPIEFKKPTAQQLEYALDLGITIPEDACHEDVSCLICRVTEDDEKSPPVPLALYADRKGAHFSAWIGEKAFFNMLYIKLEHNDRLAFFAYCVYCYLYSKHMGDMDESNEAQIFYDFADEYSAEHNITVSLNKLEGEALIQFGTYEGKTSTSAYMLAAKFLSERIKK